MARFCENSGGGRERERIGREKRGGGRRLYQDEECVEKGA